ncbi:MAG TPA: hypothetical protein PKD86_12145 [Gemmatales bacterium]|nr:hypothetical protein [Gemmatales bacterium]HMP60094.1 hypothetical protein [Gemmatales bacterium]
MTIEQYIKLFKSLPEAETEMLIVAMKNGMEVAVQRIMRFEEHYMLVRGRLGGTDQGNLIFLIDYDNITFAYFSRVIEDYRVQEIFGDLIGGLRRSFIGEKTPKELEEEKQAAEAAAAAEAEAPSESTKPAPAPSVSALRSRLLQNRSGHRPRR